MFVILLMLLCVAVMLPEDSATTTYFVRPDHGNHSTKNAHTLSYFIMNNKTYFTSYTKLQFLPGMHHLKNDLFLHSIKNFTILGNGSTIHCNSSSVHFGAMGVMNLTIQSIDLVNCGRSHYMENRDTKYNYSGVVYLNNCSAVLISNVLIIPNRSSSGIVATNVYAVRMSRVTISLNCYCLSPVNGIEFIYNDYNNKTLKNKKHVTEISHYTYRTNGLCNNSYAFYFVMVQRSYGVSINIQGTNFNYLRNSSILYYYGESCGNSIDNKITFNKCTFNHNYGNPLLQLNMFYILVNSDGYIFSSIRDKGNCDRQLNVVNFRNCHCLNNSYMNSVLYFHLQGSLSINANIDIKNSSFLYNHNVQIIYVKSEVEILWQLSNYIIITSTNISSNAHTDMVSMISSTNGLIKLSEYVTIKNNSYEYIIQMHFSVLRYQGYIEFSSNFARKVLKANEESYYLLKEHSTLKITNNLVYSATESPVVYNEDMQKYAIISLSVTEAIWMRNLKQIKQ